MTTKNLDSSLVLCYTELNKKEQRRENMKKNIAFWIFWSLSIAILMRVCAFTVQGLLDLKNASEIIAATPGSSGVDYLGLHFGFFLLLCIVFVFSILGALFSFISCKCAASKALRTTPLILMLIHLLIVISCICAWILT